MRKNIYNIIINLSLLVLSLVALSACSKEKETPPQPTPGTTVQEERPAPTPTPTPEVLITPAPEVEPEKHEPVATPSDLPVNPPPATATDLPPDLFQELGKDPNKEEAPYPSPRPTPADHPDRENFSPLLEERERVDDSFFEDAAFFGNSLMKGLGAYGRIRSGDFVAATSASVLNVELTHNVEVENGDPITLFDALIQKEYAKIYMLLGINEISFDPNYFGELYGKLIDRIRLWEPVADIYIMSLSPVTESCSNESPMFNMDRIRAYNEVLFALAEEKECYFVDLCQALAEEDGYLAEDMALDDGIHLQRPKYLQWEEYLRTHYADPLTAE